MNLSVIKKGPYVQEALMKRVLAMNEAGEKKVLKTWSRSSTIFPDFVSHVAGLVSDKIKNNANLAGRYANLSEFCSCLH